MPWDLDYGFDEIIVVALDEKIKSKIENELKNLDYSIRESVKIFLVSNY